LPVDAGHIGIQPQKLFLPWHIPTKWIYPMHEDLTEREHSGRIRIRFHFRIIPLIFNPCECAIRIEPVIITGLTKRYFPLNIHYPLQGDAVPGVDRR
jgi:hypothetical protein